MDVEREASMKEKTAGKREDGGGEEVTRKRGRK